MFREVWILTSVYMWKSRYHTTLVNRMRFWCVGELQKMTLYHNHHGISLTRKGCTLFFYLFCANATELATERLSVNFQPILRQFSVTQEGRHENSLKVKLGMSIALWWLAAASILSPTSTTILGNTWLKTRITQIICFSLDLFMCSVCRLVWF